MIYRTDEQGSDAWLVSRKGCITGSRFKDARDRLADKPEKVCKKTGEITLAVRGGPSAKCLRYAYDVARERCGGTAPGAFNNAAMKFGTEQEPLARMAYEALTGNLVDEVGFITDDERMFGCSPDGLIDADGVLEIKTMVSSDTLFTAVADGDISEYMDQCLGYLWLLGRQWVDLVLWAPDLEPLGLHITVIRINRDETAIEALEADLTAFAGLVRENEAKLRMAAEKLKPKGEIMEIESSAVPAPEIEDVAAANAMPTEALPPTAAQAEPAAQLQPEIAPVAQEPEVGQVVTHSMDEKEMVRIAKLAISRGWDFETLTYCDAMYGFREFADEVYDLVLECREIGTVAFDAKYSPQRTIPDNSPPTLRLGQIADRLGFALPAAFLQALGFEPAGKDRAAVLYHEADYPRICAALAAHVQACALAIK